MTDYRVPMFADKFKDCILYIIPQFVFEHVFRNRSAIEFIYDSVLNSDDSKKPGFLLLIELAVALLLSAISIPVVAIVLFCKVFIAGEIYIHRVEIAVTTFCTLKCKDCSNLMQYYNSPYHVDLDILKRSVEGLLESIDSLRNLVILGGEPLVYPEIAPFLEYVISQKKIKRIHILTNGIVMLNDPITKLLSDTKVTVNVSDYGLKEDQINKTCGILKSSGVTYGRIRQRKWFDFGDLSDKGRSTDEVQEQFKKCKYKCKCILNGRLYICPRASHGMDLGVYGDNANVDLLDKCETEIRREKILAVYYSDRFIPACRYCDAGTDSCVEIDCGEQR